MKQLLLVTTFTFLLTAFTVQKLDSKEITQMVITVPGLNSKSLQKDLEADINKLSGIKFIETSLISKTLILNYDAHKMSLDEVDHILNKWGCRPGESSFHNLFSMQ